MSRVGERRGRLSKVGEWLAIAQLGVEPGFYMGYSTIRCWLRVIDVIDVDAQLVCFHGDGDRFHKVGYLCWMPPIVRVRFLAPCFILIVRGLVTMARYPWLWALRFKCSMTPTLMWYLLYIICYISCLMKWYSWYSRDVELYSNSLVAGEEQVEVYSYIPLVPLPYLLLYMFSYYILEIAPSHTRRKSDPRFVPIFFLDNSRVLDWVGWETGLTWIACDGAGFWGLWRPLYLLGYMYILVHILYTWQT